MPTARLTAGLPPQPHQGGGARLLRRLGGAVRSAIVGGIALLRRPAPSVAAAPQNSRDQAAAPSRVPPCTSPAPRERSPAKRAGEGSVPRLPDLLASRLASRHSPSEAASRPAFLNQTDAPFTPEACPQLSAKACAVLNTPLEDCDPKTLELLLSAFAQHMSELMSPEAAITDPATSLPDLWHRLSTALADPEADTSSPATLQAVPAAPAEAPPARPKPWTNDVPRLSPVRPAGPPASDQPAEATIAAAPRTPSAPVVHRSRSFRHDTQSFPRWRRPLFRRPGRLPPVSARRRRRQSVILRKCYAASTGPP